MASLARYAWCVLVYNLGVILWGAYVRATGSGAGCGNHWPLCNGEVVPRAAAIETLVEYSHRLTSGLALVSVVVLVLWARRATRRGHPVRLGATLSLAFMLSEALLGAGLVLFGLVAQDASASRAAVVAAHLLNTFLLVGSLTLTAWWAAGGQPLQLTMDRGRTIRIGAAALAILVVSSSGAVTALGDTLFPSGSLAEGLSADLSDASHFLIRLRTIHPVIAVASALFLLTLAWQSAGERRDARPTAVALTWLIGLQIAVGMMNVLLLAPVWLQLTHLLIADALWIAFVLLAARVLSPPVTTATQVRAYARPA